MISNKIRKYFESTPFDFHQGVYRFMKRTELENLILQFHKEKLPLLFNGVQYSEKNYSCKYTNWRENLPITVQ